MKFAIIFAVIIEFIYKYLKSIKKGTSEWGEAYSNKEWSNQSFAEGYKGVILLCAFFTTLICIEMGGTSFLPSIISKEFLIKYFDLAFYLLWALIIIFTFKKEIVLEIKKIKSYFTEKMGFSLLVLVFVFIGSVASNIILNEFNIISQNEQMVEAAKTSFPTIVFLYAVILGPFVEEIIYRGIIFKKICGKEKEKIRTIVAYIITALIFALAHTNVKGLIVSGQYTDFVANISIFIVSLGLSLIYKKTENISYSIMIHMLLNYIAL